MSRGLRYINIANPGSKRWKLYERELVTFWRERNIKPRIELVSWQKIIENDGNLDAFPIFDEPAVVRLESPGRDFAVTQLLLKVGVHASACAAAEDTLKREHQLEDTLKREHQLEDTLKREHQLEDTLKREHQPEQKGLLLHPRLYYRGFAHILHRLRRSFDRRPHLHLLQCPLAILEMFDKNATLERLRRANIPVPETWPAPAAAQELLITLKQARFAPAYVKLNTGASAMGIAVVHALAPRPFAITTMLRRGADFFNTRRLQRIDGDDLDKALAFLLAQGACIQRGIRPAQIDGQNFDVRVVVIYGRPAFTIFRLSSHPMTNLHLGGRRGCPQRCRQAIPPRAWLDAVDHCVEAARLYPNAVAGVDLIFERDFRRHYVLEVNAFGDFFPGVADERGRPVHRAELEATATRFYDPCGSSAAAYPSR